MCDCSWASTSGACSGGGDGTECWYACCRVPATPSNGFTTPSNPFKHNAFYVNPTYRQHIRSTKEHSDDPVIQAALESLINVPSAYWLDTKERLTGAAGSTDNLEGILADAASFPTPPLCVFIVYDLPNRDCKALASNGEICCTYHADGTCDYETAGDCQQGLAEYKSEYIDPMRAILERYTKVPVILVVEPDSLPNLVTNQADARCGNPATNNLRNFIATLTWRQKHRHKQPPQQIGHTGRASSTRSTPFRPCLRSRSTLMRHMAVGLVGRFRRASSHAWWLSSACTQASAATAPTLPTTSRSAPHAPQRTFRSTSTAVRTKVKRRPAAATRAS